MLHAVLFEYIIVIELFVAIFILIWFCINLKRSSLRYQFSRFGMMIMGTSILSINCVASSMNYFLGVFWCLFVPIIVSINDMFAYFVGRSFGRTPLIKLSPNKTLEGFVGGAVFTFIFVFIFMGTIFGNKWIIC